MNTRERFEDNFTVFSYETDRNGKLSLYSLLNRFQELAGNHAAYLNVGREELRGGGLAWILSRIKVQVNSLPSWGEKVQLATWPKGIDRIFALRDFSISNHKNESLVRATSAWLLVDMESRRPRRIETLQIDLRFPDAVQAIKDPLGKIPVPERLKSVFEKTIRLSDIDVNNHVNNAHYAKWITDCFSTDEFRSRSLKVVQINYLEESFLGDTITLYMAPADNSSTGYFISGISCKNSSPVFHACVEWD